MTDVKKFVIERERWFRGRDNARLLVNVATDSPDFGKMCCLGFFGIACGIDPEQLLGMGSPEDRKEEPWSSWVLRENDETGYVEDSRSINSLIAVNDDRKISDAARESRITELFAKHGVEVEFVDGPVTAEAKVRA